MEKVNQVIGEYVTQLERKEIRIKKLQSKQFDTELTTGETLTLTTLETECRMIKQFIDDLGYINK